MAQFSRAQGASSGAETWALALFFLAAVSFFLGWGPLQFVALLVALFALQVCLASSFDLSLLYYGALSQKLGPATMRNGSIGFAECVRPGGKPTHDHCLSIYSLSPMVSSLVFVFPAFLILALNPIAAAIRPFYPEHRQGVNSGRYWALYRFFMRHPMAVQGEGPSNGDGLAGMCASEALIFPITPSHLQQGPLDEVYWSTEGRGRTPNLRDMFHDKIWCHRFFRSHGVACPILVAEVEEHACKTVFLDDHLNALPNDKLIWKPRYSTMGLGVEHFTGWGDQGDAPAASGVGGWAPSNDPYVVEEKLQSTEYDHSEWYRCTTLWHDGEAAPRPGYVWRMRNQRGDKRVQTDILGGVYCVTDKWAPFVGPGHGDGGEAEEKGNGGFTFDPRTGEHQPMDAKVHTALTTGIGQMQKMHASLGKELYSIGWDVMIVGETPTFIEFNINNGFFVGDHSVEECNQMVDYFEAEFNARVGRQLINFDPYADEKSKEQ